MAEVIILAIVAFTFFALGWRTREKAAEYKVNKYMKELEKASEEAEEKVMNVYIHAEHGVFYVFNKETEGFITQVSSKEELMDFFKKNHSDKNVLISKDDLALFDTV